MPKHSRLYSSSDSNSKRQKTNMYGKKRTIARARRSYGRDKSLSRTVNAIIDKRIETKFACNEYSALDILGTPFFDELTNIGQGATEGTRVGVHLNPTYMEVKLAFIGPVSQALGIPFIRIMVVQTKGDPLVVGDMPVAYGTCPDFDQYNVWFDSIIYLGGMVTSVANPVGAVWEYSKVLKRAPGVKQDITYDGTAGAAQSGGIYVFAIAGDADIDINDGYGLLKYKDA